MAVALPGARLPGGLQLEQRKVRGELSDGMILAEDEVELGSDHSGIMVLPEIEPGTPLGDVLPLVEEVLLVESTGNRPDLLSIYGLAREVAALYDLSLSAMPGGQSLGPVPDGQVEVQVDDFAGCPRYIGRVFRDVSLGQSPIWLRARLTNAGMRPISNVVDVTNYVMLALGNPLHAFDLAKLAGGRIVVRRAQPGETIRTLDGVDRKLEPEDLMIADAERSVALAGIMGGEETEISDETTEVLLEAANFEPTGIFRSSERLRLRTEGSNRWEKGVDPYLAEPAAESRHAAAGRHRRGGLGGRRRRARGAARAAGDPLPARARRRADRARDAAAGAARLARAPRLREQQGDVVVPDLAGAGRDARGGRGRGGRARAARRRAVHAAGSAARCSARSRPSSACAGGSRTCSPASA